MSRASTIVALSGSGRPVVLGSPDADASGCGAFVCCWPFEHPPSANAIHAVSSKRRFLMRISPLLVFEKNGRTLSPVDRYPWQTDESCVIDLRPNQTVILHLLDDVGGPARHARAREHTCERVRLNSERVQRRRRIELDVRIEATPGLLLIKDLNCYVFEPARNSIP